MLNLIISACLLGTTCRYDGKSRPLPEDQRKELAKKYRLIPVCGEILGGLPTPRIPAERIGDRVVNQEGVDLTAQYRRGAEEVLRIAQILNADAALLKEHSPSCGCGEIYDGTFTGTLRKGDGVTAEVLKQAGIPVFGELQLLDLF